MRRVVQVMLLALVSCSAAAQDGSLIVPDGNVIPWPSSIPVPAAQRLHNLTPSQLQAMLQRDSAVLALPNGEIRVFDVDKWPKITPLLGYPENQWSADAWNAQRTGSPGWVASQIEQALNEGVPPELRPFMDQTWRAQMFEQWARSIDPYSETNFVPPIGTDFYNIATSVRTPSGLTFNGNPIYISPFSWKDDVGGYVRVLLSRLGYSPQAINGAIASSSSTMDGYVTVGMSATLDTMAIPIRQTMRAVGMSDAEIQAAIREARSDADPVAAFQRLQAELLERLRD